jgi:glycosyltransferase involved in cell wall biosynthesis
MTVAGAPSAGRRIAVCICTRDRTANFARCLSSVLAQRFATVDDRLWVVVVDNSDVGTEREHVDALVQQNAPVTYVHEPRSGIPFARNAALDAALSLGPAWIVFLDDDEVAPHGWLSRLLQVADLTGADVVHGGVVSAGAAEIAGLAVSWRPSDALPRSRRTNKAATNNVLLRPWLVADPVGLRFDERMHETGGSDGEFFMRVRDTGGRMVRTGDAPVFEERSDERETPAHQRLRAFRVGANCNYRYRKNRRPCIVAALLILGRVVESSGRGALRVSLSLAMMAVNRPRARSLVKKGVLDACFAWGCVAPYFGLRPKAYY